MAINLMEPPCPVMGPDPEGLNLKIGSEHIGVLGTRFEEGPAVPEKLSGLVKSSPHYSAA